MTSVPIKHLVDTVERTTATIARSLVLTQAHGPADRLVDTDMSIRESISRCCVTTRRVIELAAHSGADQRRAIEALDRLHRVQETYFPAR